MRTLWNKSSIRVLALVAAAGMAGMVQAQQAGGRAPQQPLTGAAREKLAAQQEMLRDFIHFILINRPDVAAGVGTKLLNEKLTPVEFVNLIEQSGEQARFQNAIGRAMRSPELEATAAQLYKHYETGKLQMVRDPAEVAEHIGWLTGHQRQRMLARERLISAGEYAMPQLLSALTQGGDPELRGQVSRLMIDMGQQAVTPLSASIVGLDPASQELIAGILGEIGYRTALPYLSDVLQSTQVPNVRQACERAMTKIGNTAIGADTAELYQQLGEGYYAEKPELTSFPGEPHQLLWEFRPEIGLVPTAIRTEVYHEAMAMRTADRSLTLRPQNNGRATSLWLASNFSREIQSPAGYDNPVYPKTRRDAMYYAVLAGPGPSQSVLARALDTRNTPLARRAIAAIERTAGGESLWAGQIDRQPLLEALMYPNRRVQYDAALCLGTAQPQRGFNGSERVVPLLASAIRDSSTRFAIVLASNKELGDRIRRTLERDGYTVFPTATHLGELAEPIAESPGIDLIVSDLTPGPSGNLIEEARRTPKLAVTPVMLLTEGPSVSDFERRFSRDILVSVRARGISDSQLSNATKELVERGVGGPIEADEARQYAQRSLLVLRDLAVSGNTVFDVGEAALPLIASLNETSGKMRLDIAEVLSRVNQKRAQVALADASLNTTGDERIALLGKVADSAKRYGNLLEPRQIERVMEIATKGDSQPEATAAAALVGALNLPNANVVPLILGKPV